jgi:hypothetical protein
VLKNGWIRQHVLVACLIHASKSVERICIKQLHDHVGVVVIILRRKTGITIITGREKQDYENINVYLILQLDMLYYNFR